MTASEAAESSLLLWLLSGLLLALSFAVALGWQRVAERRFAMAQGWRKAAWPLVIASMTLGAGLNGALLLALAAQALAFELGFGLKTLLLLWPGTMLACAPALVLLARWPGRAALAGAALWLALVAVAVAVGWLLGAALRPGNWWRREVLVLAAGLAFFGIGAGFALTQSESFRASTRRLAWRAGGITLLALAVFAAQELVFAAALLHEQGGSGNARVVPLTVLGLVCGVLLPLVTGLLWLDLWLRKRDDRERRHSGSSGFTPTRRRKRRHKVRLL